MLGLVWSAMCGDMIADMEYATRPYEVIPGQTDIVAKQSIELLYEAFRNRPERDSGDTFGKWDIVDDLASLQKERQPQPEASASASAEASKPAAPVADQDGSDC